MQTIEMEGPPAMMIDALMLSQRSGPESALTAGWLDPLFVGFQVSAAVQHLLVGGLTIGFEVGTRDLGRTTRGVEAATIGLNAAMTPLGGSGTAVCQIARSSWSTTPSLLVSSSSRLLDVLRRRPS